MWYGMSSWEILDLIYDTQPLPKGANCEFPLDILNHTEDNASTDQRDDKSSEETQIL